MPINKQPDNHRIRKIVAQTISDHRMLQAGDSVLVGVSGGPDSVALFHILHALADQLKITLAIGHLNHGLRGKASESDARFTKRLAAAFDVPFYLEKSDVRQHSRLHRQSIEEAAREVRHTYLVTVAGKQGMEKIALGHHADDNAESVLMHLFRGSGPLGLSGIPPVRDGRIIRPLIHTEKEAIIRFLKENKVDYVLDETNSDRTHLRNRMRHDLIPLIASSIQPQIAQVLNRAAQISKDEEDWLNRLIEPMYQELIIEQSDSRLVLSVDPIRKMHPALQRRILRRAILTVNGSLRRMTFAHIETIRKNLKPAAGIASTDLPNRIRVLKKGESLVFLRLETPLRKTAVFTEQYPHYDYPVSEPGTVHIDEIKATFHFSQMAVTEDFDYLRAGQHIAFFDMNRLRFPLHLREVRPGDRFSPLGMTGTQKIKDFFINQKIPREDRSKYPLLLCDGKIIWVAGLRIDASVRMTASTQTVLRAEWLLPDAV